MPSAIVSVGRSAFNGCSSLETLIIPDSVKTIGIFAFSGCSKITSITIPNSVVSIDDNAFSGCSSLEKIIIPNSVTTIGESTFSNCKKLKIYGFENSEAEAYAQKNNIPFIAINEQTTEKEVIYGDANLDGNVTVADAVAILQFIGNKDKYALTAEAKANGDCYNTGDGITGNDALTIQKIDAGLYRVDELPINSMIKTNGEAQNT